MLRLDCRLTVFNAANTRSNIASSRDHVTVFAEIFKGLVYISCSIFYHFLFFWIQQAYTVCPFSVSAYTVSPYNGRSTHNAVAANSY